MYFQPGQLDQLVHLEEQRMARNAAGDELLTWLPVGRPFWAELQDAISPNKGGDEAASNGLNTVSSVTRARCWWRSSISTAMRLQWPARNRTFQITSIAELGRREAHQLTLQQFAFERQP